MKKKEENQIVIFDKNHQCGIHLLSTINFFGYKTKLTENESSLIEAIDKNEQILAIIMCCGMDLSDLPELIDTVAKQPRPPSIFVYSPDKLRDLPSTVENNIKKHLVHSEGYKPMLSAFLDEEISKYSQLKIQETHIYFNDLIGACEEIDIVRENIYKVANSETSVIIQGETGTGKEVVARSIHHHSQRQSQPFVAINCGAIPHDLIESELFGHEKGAFTGAVTQKKGKFEISEGGTLFLDEIGDLPLDLQVKLLRVLQEKSFERVGGVEPIRMDVRVIAATHHNLEVLVQQGKFRADLFYRLAVFPIHVPPLRDRTVDIPILVDIFSKKQFIKTGRFLSLSDEAIDALVNYAWPGNVRQLLNLIERLAILYPNKKVALKNLPPRYRPPEYNAGGASGDSFSPDEIYFENFDGNEGKPLKKMDLKKYLSSIEKNLIIQSLNRSNWVVSQAASTLNIKRTTLVEKMKKLNITGMEMTGEPT